MLKALGSAGLFAALCAALAAACALGALTGGALFGSPWFAALGALLFANGAACAARRLPGASRAWALTHLGALLLLAGTFASAALRFEGSMPLRPGSESAYVYSGDSVFRLPFKVRLENFRLEHHGEPGAIVTLTSADGRREFKALPGAQAEFAGARVKVLRQFRDLAFDAAGKPGERSAYWHNPAAELEVSSGGKARRLWAYAGLRGARPEGLPFHVAYALEQAYVKNYTSDLLITPDEGHGLPATVSPGRPFRQGGYLLLQSGYDTAAGYSLLTVTRDLGAPLAYAGLALLLTGILLWLKD